MKFFRTKLVDPDNTSGSAKKTRPTAAQKLQAERIRARENQIKKVTGRSYSTEPLGNVVPSGYKTIKRGGRYYIVED